MPQMMPINWLISLFFFITIFILFNITNYYIFIAKLENKNTFSNKKLSKNQLLWKW